MSTSLLTPDQIRAARDLLQWSRAKCATKLGVSEGTLSKIERFGITPRVFNGDYARKVFEAAGVEFYVTPRGSARVRLVNPAAPPARNLDVSSEE